MAVDQRKSTIKKSGNDAVAGGSSGTTRRKIGSLEIERPDAVSSTIGKALPEKWRDPIAVVLIFLSLIIFFSKVLDSEHVLNAGDNVASESFKPFLAEADKQGVSVPQWMPNIFCGMPAFAGLVVTGERTYDIAHEAFDVIQAVPRALFPNPDAITQLWHYFILGLGVYLLLRVTRNTSRLVALFGAFSTMFSTWIITYVMIGHNTKIFAIMTFPYILMSIEKLRTPKIKWPTMVFWSAALGISFHFMLESTHWQMVFYILLSVLIYFLYTGIAEIVKKVRNKGGDVMSALRAGVISLAMVALAFGMSADRYLSTRGYEPYSIRGASPIVDKSAPADAQKPITSSNAVDESGGLDWNYATAWSFSPQEVITFLIPGWYGFGKMPYTGTELNIPPDTRIPTYWGQMNGTDAANYTGIIVFFFGIIAILTLWKRDRLVAPLALISLVSLLLSFGGNWPILFGPMFRAFPMFNKFRAPMMALVLMQLSFPILAALMLENVLKAWRFQVKDDENRLAGYFKWGMFVAAGLLVVFLVGRSGFEGSIKSDIAKSGKFISQQQYAPLQDYAASVAMNDAAICFFFAAAACAMVYFFVGKRKLSPLMLGVGIFVLTVIDLWRVDSRPMEVTTRDQYAQNFAEHDWVNFIKQDKSLHRVLDLNEPTSNVPVAWGKQTIAGYHAAKMRAYQDVVDVTGNGNGNVIFNPFMWNLLNTKYIVANGGLSEDQTRFQPVFQSREAPQDNGQGQKIPTIVWMNPQVLPRTFLVNRFEVKPNLDILHAMHEGTFDPRDVVYFDEQPKELGALATQPVDTARESATVSNYGIENIEIKTSTLGDRLVFMSDTWYPDWTATVDGKPTPIYKANYAFRAIKVPAGQHVVKLSYYDPNYHTGKTISLTANLIAIIGLAVGVGSASWHRKRKLPEVETIPSPEVAEAVE